MADHPTTSRFAMSIRLPRRQLFLFVLAVVLPCALLLALGTRLLMQDRELAAKRLADHQRQMADAVGRAVFDRLERIKLEEATAFAAYLAGRGGDHLAQRATVFVASMDSAGPQPAWTSDARLRHAALSLGDTPFANLIAKGTRAELGAHDTASAGNSFRAAIQIARDSVQTAYAELMLARSLRPTATAAARSIYERMLATDLRVRDEEGIPFAVYAAQAIARDANGNDRIEQQISDFSRRATAQVSSSRTLSPAACYALVGLRPSPSLRARCAEIERAEVMLHDPAALAALHLSASDSARWVAADSGRWLVSRSEASVSHPAVLVGVRLADIDPPGSAVAEEGGRLVPLTRNSIPVGHGIEDIAVTWPSPVAVRSSNLVDAFYATALATVLGIVLLGGYFLWRDVHREVRLAHLRSQFVASVSHELKTPLTSIRIFAETLRDRSNVDATSKTEYLDTIARESERLTRLLQDVLDFSRIERGERKYQLAPEALPQVVERALRTLRFPLEQQGFSVVFHCDDQFASVRCDADAIEQAIINLVSNAMKYSGTSRRIDVRLERRVDTMALSVTDFGIGIAPAHQENLFERFYRAPTRENDSIPGTGLGLTLVEHIVHAHGGRVSVDSAQRRGSTFTLYLPVTPTVPAVPSADTTEPSVAAAIAAPAVTHSLESL